MFLSLYSYDEQCFTYSLQLRWSLDSDSSILTWSFLKNVFCPSLPLKYSNFWGVFNLIHSVSADEKNTWDLSTTITDWHAYNRRPPVWWIRTVFVLGNIVNFIGSTDVEASLHSVDKWGPVWDTAGGLKTPKWINSKGESFTGTAFPTWIWCFVVGQ